MTSVNIGANKQFLADDLIIDTSRSSGISRAVVPLQKHGSPVLSPIPSTEGNYLVPLIAPPRINGDGSLTLWYRGANTYVANSVDGITWTRPNLGLVTFQGSTQNNIIKKDRTTVTNSDGTTSGLNNPESIVYDPNEPDPNRRYSATSHYWKTGGMKTCNMTVLFSADGLSWKFSTPLPAIAGVPGTQSIGEDHFLFGKDSAYPGKTIGYFRPYYPEPNSYGGFTGISRMIARVTSDDGGVTWGAFPPQNTWLKRDAADGNREFYYMTVLKTDGFYWGFLHRLQVDPGYFDVYQVGATGSDNTSDMELMFSRDGIVWNRFDAQGRPAFLPRGSETDWDSREIWAGVPVEVSGKLHFYYAGSNVRHTIEEYGTLGGNRRGQIGLATMKKDRFVAMRAGAAIATFTTRPVVFSGTGLSVNYLAQAGGSLTIEIQDAYGNPLSGFTQAEFTPVSGDVMSHNTSWTSGRSLSSLAGTPIRIKFILKNADLYTFQFQ